MSDELRERIATALHASDEGRLYELADDDALRMADAVLPLVVSRSTYNHDIGVREEIVQRLLGRWRRTSYNNEWVWRRGTGRSDTIVPMSPADVAWFTEHHNNEGASK